MKVNELKKICDQLVEEGHGEYDVTVELMNDEYQRELVRNFSVIKCLAKELGVLILRTGKMLNWF